MFNIKNVARGYESDVYKLRYSLSMMLVQSVLLDSQNHNFDYSKKIIDILKSDNLLIYTTVKHNDTEKVVLGDNDEQVSDAKSLAKTNLNIEVEDL